MKRDDVVEAVERLTAWWIKRRSAKIVQGEHKSMEVNPFLAPLLCSMHGLSTARDLASFVTAGHFYIGHGTGFGKLIDEKILPEAFGAIKLDKKYRQQAGLTHPAYDDIDHVVIKPDGRYLLSQKAGKWTIQLGQAIGLNRSFNELLNLREKGQAEFRKIIVGAFYGHGDDLTDKYRILRGITTGAAHDVVDISAHVDVLAGRAFWSWLADDAAAQEWVMSGIYRAIASSRKQEQRAQIAAETVEREVGGMLGRLGDIESEQDWVRFINEINR